MNTRARRAPMRDATNSDAVRRRPRDPRAWLGRRPGIGAPHGRQRRAHPHGLDPALAHGREVDEQWPGTVERRLCELEQVVPDLVRLMVHIALAVAVPRLAPGITRLAPGAVPVLYGVLLMGPMPSGGAGAVVVPRVGVPVTAVPQGAPQVVVSAQVQGDRRPVQTQRQAEQDLDEPLRAELQDGTGGHDSGPRIGRWLGAWHQALAQARAARRSRRGAART